MEASQLPARIPLPFAENAGAGFINTIPTAHSGTAGRASLNDGFPPACFTAPEAGGVPPFGADFNGALNWFSAAVQAFQSGYMATYDATHSTDIGGYFEGAILLSADGTHWWRSQVDNNSSDPDTGGSNWSVVEASSVPFASITGVPAFTLESEFTGSNQSLGASGYQKIPGGLILQWVSIAVSGASDTDVTVTYPITFPTLGHQPIPSVLDPARAGDESNALLLSVISFTNSGCVIGMGQNGGGARDVTLKVLVPGH